MLPKCTLQRQNPDPNTVVHSANVAEGFVRVNRKAESCESSKQEITYVYLVRIINMYMYYR